MVSPEMFRVEKSEWVQGTRFQCPACKERKNIEEGDRKLIATGGRIKEAGEFCFLEMYWIVRLD